MSEMKDVRIPRELYDFLLGAGPLEGCWFGDRPDGAKGAFWWRTELGKCAALESAPKPAGGEWVTVPREPTPEMTSKGDCCLSQFSEEADGDDVANEVYRAMLAAAPPAPAASTSGGEVERERDEARKAHDIIVGSALKWRDRLLVSEARASELQREVERKDAALVWYENNVAGCRLIHSGGHAHRAALDEDGGSRARAALQQAGESDGV